MTMNRNRLVLAGLLTAVVLVVSAGGIGSPSTARAGGGDDGGAVVWTDAGPVRGTVTDTSRLFQGIPYAAPPKGELRWAPPRPVRPWSKVRDATRPGSMRPQQPSSYADVASLEEDCLVLNVTTPRSAGRRRPVLVWVHGDGAIGAGSFFDGRPLATRGEVVVVTINYRLGIFGTFGYPGLADSGTFGLQDQQAALGWVARNAAAFGGDPGNVTLFGESYGGLSTSAHLVAPSSGGLFHRAIIQSGFALMDLPAGALFPGLPAVEWFGWTSAAEVEALGASVAPQLGCADPATALVCLRRVPVKDLLDHAQGFQAYAFGNRILPEVPARALADGRFHRVPVLAGATRDEHRLFVGLFRVLAGQPVTAEQYPQLLAEAFGEHAGRVLARYPLSAYPSPNLAWATVLTDRMWARSTFTQHRLLSERVPVYAYEFADRQAPMYLPFPPDFPPGAFHAAEVPYLFPDPPFQAGSTPDQRRLSDGLIRYWTNFAHTGDPNGDDLPPWHRFADARPVPYVQALAPGRNGTGPVDYAAEHQLDFWSQLP
jgi:para-nitrobenzyl esterase